MANKQEGKGKQGFASMDEDKQREIASKGGRTAHQGEEPRKKGEAHAEDFDDDSDEEEGKGKQGFASMDKEKVREIASKGGRTSHQGEEPHEKGEAETEYIDDDSDEEEGKGKQGFASMDKEKVRKIASKGGKASHKGEE